MCTIAERLVSAGLTLPTPAAAVANYVPFTISGNLVTISGQLPFDNGAIAITGLLGREVTLDQGYAAARICALNLLSQLQAACDGDLGRVRRCVRLGGFVASTSDFIDHPKVVNGASDLMVEILADAGRHARFAVGVASLPLGAPVEVDGMFEIDN